METLKNIGYVLLGIVIALFLTFIVLTIASAINGISIGSQITQWFGSIGNKASKAATVVTQTSII